MACRDSEMSPEEFLVWVLSVTQAEIWSTGTLPAITFVIGSKGYVVTGYAQAIHAYAAALDLAPDYNEARLGLGDAQQAQGRIEAAIAEYERVLATEPESARGHYALGKIYYSEKGLYHEAVAEFQRAISLEPRLLEAHLSLGDLFSEKGLHQEAIDRYRCVLSIDPQHPGAAYGLALVYEQVDISKAVQQWERYIDLASTLPSEKDWVGIAKKHLQKLQRAGTTITALGRRP